MESKKNTEETEDSLRSELDMWQQQTDKTKQQATQLADSVSHCVFSMLGNVNWIV